MLFLDEQQVARLANELTRCGQWISGGRDQFPVPSQPIRIEVTPVYVRKSGMPKERPKVYLIITGAPNHPPRGIICASAKAIHYTDIEGES